MIRTECFRRNYKLAPPPDRFKHEFELPERDPNPQIPAYSLGREGFISDSGKTSGNRSLENVFRLLGRFYQPIKHILPVVACGCRLNIVGPPNLFSCSRCFVDVHESSVHGLGIILVLHAQPEHAVIVVYSSIIVTIYLRSLVC